MQSDWFFFIIPFVLWHCRRVFRKVPYWHTNEACGVIRHCVESLASFPYLFKQKKIWSQAQLITANGKGKHNIVNILSLLLGSGVTVNALHPGVVSTEIIRKLPYSANVDFTADFVGCVLFLLQDNKRWCPDFCVLHSPQRSWRKCQGSTSRTAHWLSAVLWPRRRRCLQSYGNVASRSLDWRNMNSKWHFTWCTPFLFRDHSSFLGKQWKTTP